MWLIDQVLRANAFPTHHKDERKGDFLETLYAIHFGYASVTSILRNLQHAHPVMMPGVTAPVVDPQVHPQAPPIAPPPLPAGPADPFSMSYAQYEAIIQGQQALQFRQLAFESHFEDFATSTTDSFFEMRSLLRGLSGLSPAP
ncbi:hypothetical protein MRB53_026076 [Persea americana]|uniref:Uncharacterized protein n=1 Tax=Persea americana TaxID=3435 RepID=A0ACC2LHB3_PERAE|nr:hypothetical protein MRB53_026076 [Persea americana]